MSISYSRQPCPGRIWDDIGGAFAMGCAGGSILYFFKGFFNSPRRERFFGGLRHVKNRAPLLGGSFALWGGCFSSCDCIMIYLRKKDDPINAIVAGFITGGILAIRGGATVAFKNAILGGVILGIIEGTSVFMNALQMKQQLKMMHEAQKQQQLQQQKQQELAQEKKHAEGGTWGDFQQDFDTAEIAKKDIGF